MKYLNPVIRGMYPDPSICAANGKYYMVCSTFQFFPGVPVFESTDMINWTQIGHCLTRHSQVYLDDVRSSGGIFAPTIRFHEGRFYMVTTNDSLRQNFYVYTDDIYGEWSEPIVVEQDGIDPSLFFEDGRSYFISNGADEKGLGCIQMCEIDINTGKKLTESKVLWQGTGGRFLEAPHLYHFGEYYYLLEAEGGTEYGHMVNYSRSKSMWGPFEPYPQNPVLTNRNLGGYPIQAAGHGDILQDNEGNWWFAHLAFRQIDKWLTFHHLGREVCVVPMRWREDGWFELGVNATTPVEVDLPDTISFAPQNLDFCDTFETLSLDLDWCFLRKPAKENYLLSEKSFRLKGTDIDLNQPKSPTFIGTRQKEFDCDIRLDITPGAQEAGISIYMDENHHYELCAKREYGETLIFSRQTIGCISATSDILRVPDETVTLHIASTPLQYHFYATSASCEQEMPLHHAETRYLSSEVAGGFTGTFLGLYAVNTANTDEWSEITDFSIAHKEN